MKFGTIRESLGMKMRFAKHWGKKNAPTILTIAGLVIDIGAAVWACYKTLRLEYIVAKRDDKLEKLDREQKNMTDKQYNRALYLNYMSFFGEMALNYAGPVAAGALGIAFVLKGHTMVLTSLASVSTMLTEALRRESDLEEEIRRQLGDDALVKLKMGEPIGTVYHEDGDGGHDCFDIWEDPDGFDFYWGPGMRGFSEKDVEINRAVIRDGNSMFLRATVPYAGMAKVNDIYRYFGAYDKVDTMYDTEEVGIPNKLIQDDDDVIFEGIPLDKNGNKCDTEPFVHTCYGYMIHFLRKPIPCRELNIDAGFQKKRSNVRKVDRLPA